jgi:hypothetical protein
MMNQFDTWRFSSVHTLKIVLNNYSAFELGKPYDPFSLQMLTALGTQFYCS